MPFPRGGAERAFMSRTPFLFILAILALSFGLACAIAPAPLWGFYGLETSGAALLPARLLGAALLAWGLILWAARHFDDHAAETILISTGIADAVGAAAVSVAVVSGAMNAFGFGLAGLYLLCGMGCAFVLVPRERRVYAVGESFIGPIV
jgi:hypothetical protein